jgi:hypothetical protein
MSTNIAEAVMESSDSESFFSRHKKTIVVVVIILLIVIAIWYQYGSGVVAKMQSGGTELSKRIDETIITINKKQSDKLQN